MFKNDLLPQERWWTCPRCGLLMTGDRNTAINLRRLGISIPARRGELTSVDMEALALSKESETSVGILATERSRKLVEQAE